MKCVLMTLEAAERSVGLLAGAVAAAIRVIDIEEVFVARIAWLEQILERFEKMRVLRLTISWRLSEP